MYRNLVPILAVFIISGGIRQAYAADYQPEYQQQAEFEGVVCHHQESLNENYTCGACRKKMNKVDMVFYAGCKHQPCLGMHKNCKQRMQEEITPSWMGCPICEFNSPM